MGLDLTRKRDQKPLLGRGRVPEEVKDRLKHVETPEEEEDRVADVDLPKSPDEIKEALRSVRDQNAWSGNRKSRT